jgi:hypothetical protein
VGDENLRERLYYAKSSAKTSRRCLTGIAGTLTAALRHFNLVAAVTDALAALNQIGL